LIIQAMDTKYTVNGSVKWGLNIFMPIKKISQLMGYFAIVILLHETLAMAAPPDNNGKPSPAEQINHPIDLPPIGQGVWVGEPGENTPGAMQGQPAGGGPDGQVTQGGSAGPGGHLIYGGQSGPNGQITKGGPTGPNGETAYGGLGGPNGEVTPGGPTGPNGVVTPGGQGGPNGQLTQGGPAGPASSNGMGLPPSKAPDIEKEK
jgi:hypothetical protein